MQSNERIAVIGLGYVGMPVALAFARNFPNTIAFDINQARIEELCNGCDRTGELSTDELRAQSIHFTSNPADLCGASFFVVCVPTPVDKNHCPDLTALRKASELVGRAITPGAIVVYESTVYPGVTEEFCGPILARASGLRQSIDFKLGYSPERINPGDKEHTLARITKVVSGEDDETLDRVAAAYGAIVEAGVFRATSIKVAEAAKVIENTQRDLNIALMNELAIIFDRMNIRTSDVLDAASTKWNFLRFSPGLVGGHCIGVDPYYLTAKAQELGYNPQVILAGRRLNDNMGSYIARRMVKMMAQSGVRINEARVGILGLTFKEDVPDLRNSRVPDIITELREFGITTLVHDPLADVDEALEEYHICLSRWEQLTDLDGLILAVPHRSYREMPREVMFAGLRSDAIAVDVKSVLDPETLPRSVTYWSL